MYVVIQIHMYVVVQIHMYVVIQIHMYVVIKIHMYVVIQIHMYVVIHIHMYIVIQIHMYVVIQITQENENIRSHLSWIDTLMKTFDNRAYPERITFDNRAYPERITFDNRAYPERITFYVVTLFWNCKIAAAFARLRHYIKIDNSLFSHIIWIREIVLMLFCWIFK